MSRMECELGSDAFLVLKRRMVMNDFFEKSGLFRGDSVRVVDLTVLKSYAFTMTKWHYKNCTFFCFYNKDEAPIDTSNIEIAVKNRSVDRSKLFIGYESNEFYPFQSLPTAFKR